jgi:hypothetical protein
MTDVPFETHGSGQTVPVLDFDTAQQALLGEIGQALIAQATPGTTALSLTVRQQADGQDVSLDFQLHLERQSGLAVSTTAEEALVAAVQRLVLLWREHGRGPWRVFTYEVTRGEAGPRYTSAFDF